MHMEVCKEGARYKPLQSEKQTLGEWEQEHINVIQEGLVAHQLLTKVLLCSANCERILSLGSL